VKRSNGTLLEFPMTIERVLGKPICFFGGGYLRFFPLALILSMTEGVLQQGRPVIFYIHPREIDPAQPRLKMGHLRRFKSYVNLNSTELKLRQLLEAFEFVTLEALITKMSAPIPRSIQMHAAF
jgi:hypothetical protein